MKKMRNKEDVTIGILYQCTFFCNDKKLLLSNKTRYVST